MNLWLVRTEKNRISGPYPGEKLKEMILKGELGFQDEICEANRYWIYLHEREEVMGALGVEVPGRSASEIPGEEITETELVKPPREPDLPELASEEFAEPEGGLTENTAMLTARPSRQKPETQAPRTDRSSPAPQWEETDALAPSTPALPGQPSAQTAGAKAAMSAAPAAAADAQTIAPAAGERRRTSDFYDPQVLRSTERATIFHWLAILLSFSIVGSTVAVLWVLKTRA